MDILLKIKSIFTKEGTDDAQKQLDATARSAAQAGKTAEKSGQDINSGFAKAGSGIGSLTKGISKLQLLVTGFGIMGLIGALTSAYNLIKKISDWISDKMTASIRAAGEAAQITADRLSDEKMKLAQQMVEDVASSYDRVATSIDKANSAQRSYLTALQDLNEAQQEATALEFNRRELAALAAVPEGDDAAEAAVKARFAKMRLADSLGKRGSKAIRNVQESEDDLNAASGRRTAAEQSLADAQQKRSILADQLAYSTEHAVSHPDTGKPGYRGEWANKQNEAYQKEVEGFTAKIASLDSSITKLADVLESQKSEERAAGVRLQASRVRAGSVMEAATGLSKQQSSDIDRNTAKTQETYQQKKLAEIEKVKAETQDRQLTRSQANKNILSAQGNLTHARNFGGSSSEVAELKAALSQALADRSETMKTITDYARKASADAAYAKEALRNLPNN